jgi:hypothetical protein
MIVLDESYQPVDRVATFIWKQSSTERSARVVRLFGRLVAYLPETRRAFYSWSLAVSVRGAQQISVHQYSPPHLRLVLFSRWELGLVLGNWLLGLQLRQPLAWVRRVQTT